jgi:hypothetical protein
MIIKMHAEGATEDNQVEHNNYYSNSFQRPEEEGYYDEILEMNKDEIKMQSVVKVYAEIAAPNYFMPVCYKSLIVAINILIP